LKHIISIVGLFFVVLTIVPTSAAQPSDPCTFTVTIAAESIPVFGAPFFDYALTVTGIPVDTSYPVLQIERPTNGSAYYRLQVSNTLSGWVDARSGALDGDCSEQLANQSFLTIPVWSYLGVCEITLLEAVPIYADAYLTMPIEEHPFHGSAYGPGTYTITRLNAQSVHTYGGHAIGGVYISTQYVTDYTGCAPIQPPDVIPAEALGFATATLGAHLWTAPDVIDGQFASFLAEGTPVTIFSEGIVGRIRVDSEEIGTWYYVETTQGILSGWIWEGRLSDLNFTQFR